MVLQQSDQTLTVTILVLPEASLMSLAATLVPRRAANRTTGEAAYRWRVGSCAGQAVATGCGLKVEVDAMFDPREGCDLLIVVAAFNATRHASPALVA